MPEPIELTKREHEVAQAYVRGMSHKQIAEKLFIAPSTVRTHINTIYRKLGVKTKLELLHVLEIEPASVLSHTSSDPKPGPSRFLFAGLIFFLLATLFVFFRQEDSATAAMGPSPLETSASSTPSIAILPFSFSEADDRNRAFVEAVARDIVTDLAQFSTLYVFAADTTFRYSERGVAPKEIGDALGARYVLSGDLQWRDETVRVNAQVFETDSSRVVWAKRLERPASELLILQSEIVTNVVNVISPLGTNAGQLRRAELERVARIPTQDLRAYDHHLTGLTYFTKFERDANLRARQEFNKAIGKDPAFGKAHAYASWTHLQEAWNNWTNDKSASLVQAERHAERAIEVDPHDPYGHWALGAVRLFQRQHELSLSAFERAIQLNPNNAEILMYYGWALSYSGQADKGIEYIESAIARNPQHPGWYLWDYAFAHFVNHRYDLAAAILEQRSPKTVGTYELLALSYAMLGENDDANAALKKVLHSTPDLTQSVRAASEPFMKEEDLSHYLEAMQKAGFPH